jgi:hypothetical protein
MVPSTRNIQVKSYQEKKHALKLIPSISNLQINIKKNKMNNRTSTADNKD